MNNKNYTQPPMDSMDTNLMQALQDIVRATVEIEGIKLTVAELKANTNEKFTILLNDVTKQYDDLNERYEDLHDSVQKLIINHAEQTGARKAMALLGWVLGLVCTITTIILTVMVITGNVPN